MSTFAQYLKIVFILLLAPIGLLAGFVLADTDRMDITARGSVMLTTVFLVFVFWVAMSIAAIIGQKAGKRVSRHRIVQWVSIGFWLPVGVFPGINGFGLKYMILATVLPSITIYYLFQWQKTVVIKKSEANECKNGS